MVPPDTAHADVGEGDLPGADPGAPAVPPASGRGWRVAAFARDRAASIAAVFLLLIAGAALLAPLLSPYDPAAADNLLRYAPPGTAGHLLGTDAQGRDMLSRLLWGGRVSLVVGAVPVALASAAGLALGLLAGTAGGWTDQGIMRLLDVLFAFPMVLLAIAIAGVLRPGVWTEVISITVVLIPYVGRLARTATLSVASMPFIEAARAAGATRTALLLRCTAFGTGAAGVRSSPVEGKGHCTLPSPGIAPISSRVPASGHEVERPGSISSEASRNRASPF